MGQSAVVEVVAFLPIAPNGEFQTQFVPYISFGPGSHRYYKVSVISENSLSAYHLLSQGQTRPVKDVDEQQNMYNWVADSFPGLSEIEQLTSPSSHGHMILIAMPVEDPTPKFDLGLGDSYDFGGPMRGMGPPTYGGGFKGGGASISSASIGRGSKSGEGSLYDGEVRDSREGNPIIYHLQVLCVTPTEAKALSSNSLGQLGQGLRNFERN